MSRIQQVIDTLEAERRDVAERLAWLEKQIKEFQTHKGESTPAVSAQSVRRGSARRAGTRQAPPRTRRTDTKARIVEFLAEHPGSTATDVANSLGLHRGSVSTRLTQLAQSGEIKKAARGYSAR